MYRIIYSFHMPAFLFLTGYFARFSPKRILRRFILPYLVFQTIYLLYNSWLNPGTAFSLQFTTPHWILWYIAAITVYYLLIPAFDFSNRMAKISALAVALCGSILVGYDGTVGYYLSLSRIIVFFPFFLSGFYCGKSGILNFPDVRKGTKTALLLGSVALILLLEFYFVTKPVPAAAFYGSFPYDRTNTSPLLRLAAIFCGCLWILFLFIAVPNKHIPNISRMGRNTMRVFLLHGFVKMALQRYGVLHYSEPVNFLLAVGFVVAIMVILNLPFLTDLPKRISNALARGKHDRFPTGE